MVFLFFVLLPVLLWSTSFLNGMVDNTERTTEQREVKQENTLCSLPLDILYHIAGYLREKCRQRSSNCIHDGHHERGPRPFNFNSWDRQFNYWDGINKLASTCRYLERTVTVPNKEIRINCVVDEHRRKKDQSCSDFLSHVYNLLNRIVSRKGNNKIHLDLPFSRLTEDMSALQSFIRQCAASSISDQLVCLNLALNSHNRDTWDVIELPEELTRLYALKNLDIGANRLSPTTMERISAMSFLEKLDLSECEELTELPESFANLKSLRILYLSYNSLTKKILKILQQLPNIEEFKISNNKGDITVEDILRISVHWKKLKEIEVNGIEPGDDLLSCVSLVPSYVKVYS